MTNVILFAAGVIAGFIDSMAGGGGLITVPSLALYLGPGVAAVATNKVGSSLACLMALVIYLKNKHLNLKREHLIFALITGLGAVLGSSTAPFVPASAYKWILISIVPVILWVVWQRDLWAIQHAHDARPAHPLFWLYLSGLICGFYDGLAGPGGGTLMFLSLFILARLPLMLAVATSKIANFASAGLSFATFASQGQIQWRYGLPIAGGLLLGAYCGAELASRVDRRAVRWALLTVASLLFIRLLLAELSA